MAPRENDQEREQPVTPTLLRLLDRHATGRGATQLSDLVLRSRRGEPITARRYDKIFARARRCLSWAGRVPVSAHVLRHTAISAVGRCGGYPVAQAFAGHSPPSITGRYMRASISEIATAIVALTGEAHPLATASPRLGPRDTTHAGAPTPSRKSPAPSPVRVQNRHWRELLATPGPVRPANHRPYHAVVHCAGVRRDHVDRGVRSTHRSTWDLTGRG